MKEDVLELLKNKDLKDRRIDALASALHYDSTEEYIAFVKLMNKLEEDGEVIRDNHNNYHSIDDFHYLKGVLSLNKKGFGFVKVDEETEYYINSKNLNGAFDQDEVMIETTVYRGKPEGRVVKIIKRGMTRLVGLVRKGRRELIIMPDDPKFTDWIYVDEAHAHGAMPGHKVVVEIKKYEPYLKGDIVKIIGHKNDPGVDILSVVNKYDVDIDFPQAVYDEIESIPQSIDPSDIPNRLDIRDWQIVTIDGDDAKDLDDAISLKKLDNGNYQLGVHIADVSFYVNEGTELNKEAIRRGTSIYLVDRVIPMLPHKLSNGICSLNEGVDRYAISCIMEINNKGQVVDHNIYPTVIRSSHRMTYNNVNAILAGHKGLKKKYSDAVELFFNMKELAAILRKKRDRRGAIDFDVDEAKVLVDD